jgi:hypothetical protein
MSSPLNWLRSLPRALCGARTFCGGLWPSFYPRVWSTRLSGLKSLPSGNLGLQGPITPGSRSKSTARGRIDAQGPVVKHVDAAEARIVVAAVLADAADAAAAAGVEDCALSVGLRLDSIRGSWL